MQDVWLGRAFRKVRVKRGWRQVDVAQRARVSRGLVSMIERGQLEGVTFGALRAVATALEIRVDLVAFWHGGELGRIINAGHSAMHETTAAMFDSLSGWTIVPEVSFSIYGERGVIDVVAWHAASRALLVIELKTEIVDVQDLLGTVDRKRRLVAQIVRERGWVPRVVAAWILVADGSTNRRRVRDHERTMRAAFPAGGREIRRWLRAPAGGINALSFLSNASGDGLVRSRSPRKRIRPSRPARPVAYDTNKGVGGG